MGLSNWREEQKELYRIIPAKIYWGLWMNLFLVMSVLLNAPPQFNIPFWVPMGIFFIGLICDTAFRGWLARRRKQLEK